MRIAMVAPFGAGQSGRRYRKPAPALEPPKEPTEGPVHRGPKHVAQGGYAEQQPYRQKRVGQVVGQQRLGLHRQTRRGNER